MNKWTIDGVFTHAMDKTTRWSDIGIFDVEDKPGEDIIINIFLLTNHGAARIPLDSVLRDPALQSAAHRSFVYGQKAPLIPSIKNYITSLLGSTRENIMVLVDESKGNNPTRTGFTPAELAANVLSSTKLISYRDGIPISLFQSGGSLDQYYSEEFPILPRVNQLSANTDSNTTTVLEEARNDSVNIIGEYMQAQPMMTFDTINNEIKYSISNNSDDTQLDPVDDPFGIHVVNAIHPGYDSYPTQTTMPRNIKHRIHRAQLAEVETSEILNRKLRERETAKKQYQRPNSNGNKIPANKTEI